MEGESLCNMPIQDKTCDLLWRLVQIVIQAVCGFPWKWTCCQVSVWVFDSCIGILFSEPTKWDVTVEPYNYEPNFLFPTVDFQSGKISSSLGECLQPPPGIPCCQSEKDTTCIVSCSFRVSRMTWASVLRTRWTWAYPCFWAQGNPGRTEEGSRGR